MGSLVMRDIRGKNIPVEVQANGRFCAEYEDTHYFSDTFEGLRTKLLAASRRSAAKVALPASFLDEETGKVLAIVLTGMHATTSKLLAKDEASGKSVDIAFYDHVLRRLTAAEAADLEQLFAAKVAADVAFKEASKKLYMNDPRNDVRRAVEAKEAKVR